MTDEIVFENWPVNYDWLFNYDDKIYQQQFDKIMAVEDKYPHFTEQEKADILGISRQDYYYLKKKYNVVSKGGRR